MFKEEIDQRYREATQERFLNKKQIKRVQKDARYLWNKIASKINVLARPGIQGVYVIVGVPDDGGEAVYNEVCITTPKSSVEAFLGMNYTKNECYKSMGLHIIKYPNETFETVIKFADEEGIICEKIGYRTEELGITRVTCNWYRFAYYPPKE